MKEDVERRERAQATVIENQAKRLDELETLYKVLSPCSLHSLSIGVQTEFLHAKDIVIADHAKCLNELKTLYNVHLKSQRLH